MTNLEGKLEHITYYNQENGYTIAKLKVNETGSLVTITGYMAGVAPGETVKFSGSWDTHPKFGQQFKIETFDVVLPATIDGIKKYLESGFIKGIGPSVAKKLVKHFGEDTFDIIEKESKRLLEIDGIGKKTAEAICGAWEEHHTIRGIMQFLQEHGVKSSFAPKLLRTYGSDAVNIIREDPYRMSSDLPEIGFIPADKIARSTGVPDDDPNRARACILYAISRFVNEGHTFILKKRLVEFCEKQFSIDILIAETGLRGLTDSMEIIIEDVDEIDDQAVYPFFLHRAESGLAKKIKALMSVPVKKSNKNMDQILEEIEYRLAIELSEEQLNVLSGMFSQKIIVVSGGPGTGKTTVVKAMCAILQASGKTVHLAAPTGRAARRLFEVTGRKARTIHKMLEYNLGDGEFGRNEDDPLDADAIIVDEASMIDVILMYHLIKAVPMTSQLVLVGDVSQLPSVGPGNVLSDIIKSEIIPVFYLNTIFRQASESSIITNAHLIRNGETPVIEQDKDAEETSEELSDFYFIENNEPEKVVRTVVKLCTESIPRRFGFDPVRDIQVMTPMHKGVNGTINLNQALQQALNSNPAVANKTGYSFKIGDKVMHLRNNYSKDVFNGDIGTVCSIDAVKHKLSVDYYDKIVNYDFAELDELSLAYAISVHKSQGSEYPAVVIPLMTQHYVLLQRNLLYTAVTRAKKLVIIVGMKKALRIALENDKPKQRLSRLAHRIRSDF